MAGADDGDGRRRTGADLQRAPIALLFLGYVGFVLLVAGAILGSEVLASVGCLITLGGALAFFARRYAALRADD